MSSSDKTTLAENKVLILYVLDKVQNGLSEDGLYKLVSSINNVNYFYFKEVLTDLIDSNLVGAITKDEDNESALKLTSEGKNSLQLTIEVLPGILKLKADNTFKKEFPSIADKTSIVAEYTPKSEDDYVIRCKIIEKNETIFEVKTYAGSSERAKKIVDNWNKNAAKIYPQILNLLLDEKN